MPFEFESKSLGLHNCDEKIILDFIDVHFSEDNAAQYGLSKEDVYDLNHFRAKQALRSQKNPAMGIYEKSTQKLVGVFLGAPEQKGSGKSIGFYEESGLKLTQDMKDILVMFECLKAGMFEKLKVDKVSYALMSAIHKDYRKRGILNYSWKFAMEAARKNDCKYVVATTPYDFSSKIHFSDKRTKILNEIKFSEYRDPNTGLNPFQKLRPKAEGIHLFCIDVKASSSL